MNLHHGAYENGELRRVASYAEWLAWISTRSPCVTVRRSRGLEVLHKVTSRKVVELSWSLGLTITRSIVAVVEHPGTVDTKELGIYKIVGSGYACYQGKAIWIVLNNTRYYRG